MIGAELLYLVTSGGTGHSYDRTRRLRPVFTLKQLIGVKLTGDGSAGNPYTLEKN